MKSNLGQMWGLYITFRVYKFLAWHVFWVNVVLRGHGGPPERSYLASRLMR